MLGRMGGGLGFMGRGSGAPGVPGEPGSLDPAISAPVIALAVPATTYPPEFDALIDDTAEVGDTIRLQWSADIRFGTIEGEATNTIDLAEATANEAAFAGLSALTSGVRYFRARIEQPDEDYSAWSNVLVHGEAVDSTPAAFTFTDVSNADLSTVYESNTITLSGFNQPVTISIADGEYSLNGAAYTSASGTAYPGDTVKVRHTSSGLNSTSTATVLTVGGVSDTYTTTTAGTGDPVTLHSSHPFDTQWTGAYSQPTFTFTGGNVGTAQPDRLAIACIVSYDGGTLGVSGNQPSAVTIGGVAATKIGGSAGSHISMWQASLPTGTTADVAVTTTGGGWGGVGCILHTVRAGNPNAVVVQDTFGPDAAAPTVTPTTPTDGLTLAFAGRDATGAAASWTNATASQFKDNAVWSIGTAVRTSASSAAITAGGFGGSNNGMIAATWEP